jgi:3-hydroxymyristoyl/3-hydroxydecanoyl-(acyl carrier protein) dehydratase
MESESATSDEILSVQLLPEGENLILKKEDLEEILPHRGIALCLDQVSYMPSIKTHLFANWTPTEEYFSGHFPEKAVLPGHWQGESASIAAAVLAKLVFPEIQGLPVLVKLEMNLKRPVFPAETITISVAITERQRRIMKFSFGIVNESGKIVSEGSIIGMPLAL